jgi:hypothetical protein
MVRDAAGGIPLELELEPPHPLNAAMPPAIANANLETLIRNLQDVKFMRAAHGDAHKRG